jgi:hypothetical protein
LQPLPANEGILFIDESFGLDWIRSNVTLPLPFLHHVADAQQQVYIVPKTRIFVGEASKGLLMCPSECVLKDNFRRLRDMDRQLHEMKLALLSTTDGSVSKNPAFPAPSPVTYTSLVDKQRSLTSKSIGSISLEPDVIASLFQE